MSEGRNGAPMPGTEIERQFRLLRPASEIVEDARRDGTFVTTYEIRQSYLPDTGIWTIRARMTTLPGTPTPLYEQTLKRRLKGIERREIPIPLDERGYLDLLADCGPTLVKHRSEIAIDGRIWELDVFLNPALLGLELVEIELPSGDADVVLPEWVGEETTHLPQYRNAEIVRRLTAEGTTR